jgi:hypothetical protein
MYAVALGDIYTFGPTFRAENSNTTRHAAEFWMIEPEMAFADIYDDMDLAEDMVRFCVKHIMDNCADDLELFDKFVEKSKRIADRVYCIGKMNFFGAHNRNINGLWNNLEWALPFDRQIAFDKPEIDGKVECGMMVTGWFIWNKNYEGFPKIKVLDMQKYIRRSGKNERS